MNKTVKIGIPMEYEDDKQIIRTGLWLKEYEVEALEKRLNEYNHLQSKIDKAIEYINEEYDAEPKELYGLVSADKLLKILKED